MILNAVLAAVEGSVVGHLNLHNVFILFIRI